MNNKPTFRKLTYATAEKIRQAKRDDPFLSASDIVRLFQLPCSDSAVSAILSGRTYKTMRDGHFNPKQKLDHAKVKEIKGLLRLGRRAEWIACRFNISFSTVQKIKLGLSWTDTR